MPRLTTLCSLLLLAACAGADRTAQPGGGGGDPDDMADGGADCQTLGGENPWMQRRILNYAHRGGALEFPENTLYAYKRAHELGADVLEMDVYETADGELVVLHDSTVDRTTNGSGDVSTYTVAELQALDAAYWFVPGRGTVTDAAESEYLFRGVATGQRPPPAGYLPEDFRVPTLAQTLAAFPGVLINIELKPDPDSTGSYEAKVAALLEEYGRSDDVIVASFIDINSTLFKAAAPCVSTSVPTAQVAALVLASQGPLPMPPLPLHQAFQVPPALGLPIVTQDFVDDAHAIDLAVHVWTINDCAQMVELLNLGVDAIMTDRPQLLEQVLLAPPGQWSCDGLDGFSPEL